MSSISILLRAVNDSVNDFRMKTNYSEPKIYTGGVDVSKWSSLSRKEQKLALEKEWFVYYSFRDPKTGKLKKQSFIKGGANRFKTKKERLSVLKQLQNSLQKLLDYGFNPYENNDELKSEFFGGLQKKESVANKRITNNRQVDEVPSPITDVNESVSDNTEDIISIREAFSLAMATKEAVLSKTSFPKFKSRINQFTKWLWENNFSETDGILKIRKKDVMSYLNSVLIATSARNRNNARTDLRGLFQILKDNDIIEDNFVGEISVMKAPPKRNKSYTPREEKIIFDHLRKENPILLLFVKFISYNLLRPIEVCRLRVGDIDVEDRKLKVKAKNKPVKIKIIPKILLKDLPDLSKLDPNAPLFTPDKMGGEWDADENSKRDYFTKSFKEVKDVLGFGADYGLYSFRHTFITKMYRELIKGSTPFVAKSELMLITGHNTMTALEQYLRDIDAELPEDYSSLLKASEN